MKIILFLSILLVGPLFSYYFMHIAPFSGEKFDQKVWLNSESINQGAGCIRGPMFSDLKNNYLKKGMSLIDVKNLLGSAEYTKYENLTNCLDYNLGMCSGIQADYDSMLVCLDDKQKVDYVTHIQY